MKFILFILAFIFSPFIYAYECPKPIDASEVILFVYTNPTYKEILTARKAACERGQRLVTVPKMKMSELQTYEDLIESIYLHEEKAIYLEKKRNEVLKKLDLLNTTNANPSKINELKESLNKIYLKIQTNADELEKLYDTDIEKDTFQNNPNFQPFSQHIYNKLDSLLNDYDVNHIKVVSVILSGHSGDSAFDGNLGKVTLNDIEILSKKHKSLERFESLILLGCNTAGPSETIEIINSFPNLKFVAGFADSSPLSMFKNNLNFIYESLIYEELLKSARSLGCPFEILEKYKIKFCSNFCKRTCKVYLWNSIFK